MYVIVGHIYSQPPSQHSTVTVGRVIQQESPSDRLWIMVDGEKLKHEKATLAI